MCVSLIWPLTLKRSNLHSKQIRNKKQNQRVMRVSVWMLFEYFLFFIEIVFRLILLLIWNFSDFSCCFFLNGQIQQLTCLKTFEQANEHNTKNLTKIFKQTKTKNYLKNSKKIFKIYKWRGGVKKETFLIYKLFTNKKKRGGSERRKEEGKKHKIIIVLWTA